MQPHRKLLDDCESRIVCIVLPCSLTRTKSAQLISHIASTPETALNKALPDKPMQDAPESAQDVPEKDVLGRCKLTICTLKDQGSVYEERSR